MYYGCTRARDLNCKGGYLREEELIKQLGKILDEIDLDELGIQGQFKEEVERYYKFSKGVLGIKIDQFEQQKQTDIRNYAKYILKEGAIQEQRNLLSNLKSRLVMRDKIIRLE